MMASRLNHRGHVIPALTDHLEDKGGEIGSASSARALNTVNPLHEPNSHMANERCLVATGGPKPPRQCHKLLLVR
jgi:hypothetical protein